ncbi:metallophosphoesterase [Alkaliphilus peptidifermentans]|uniref:UDP-2,3-diacylglucosamine pyrophosphatase LpxH n=1 Tax=Alkaliphilus peptidifermentans DSM 18978 TaxID=1120976 RepID=A0A1G5LDV4_9FIRM|nr:metallophosphoesterase [Alkaliphilus peptidifermentans]SCZ10329.1 UDP-2,3-diacylglucosamine pyrophosphatase LpxH [Alkaliphilus peptidifermentans DSM 18978]
MKKLDRVSKVFHSAKEIPFDDSSRFILMSDCHRGNGDWADTFSKNQNIYYAALTHYFKENYTYIELGDGDELWQNRKLSEIIQEHSDVFRLVSEFFKEGRLYFIFGNHDIVKQNIKLTQKGLYQYFSEEMKKDINLFENIQVHEGLVLKHSVTEDKIFLIHGHQVDFLNYELWRLSRFLARYFWRPLEAFGVNDPTRTAKNYTKKESVANKLTEWVIREKNMLIAGHNHRPMFSEIDEPPYFNDGSCVHPGGITGIEIADGNILLVKWSIKTKENGILFIKRDVLAGPRRLDDYFRNLRVVFKT